MENIQLSPEIEKKPVNKNLIFIIGILLFILLIAAAAYWYFIYSKQEPSITPGTETEKTQEQLAAEFLETLGHPEKYIYAQGVVKEIKAADKTILIESSSSGSFVANEPRPQQVQKFHIVIKDTTELSRVVFYNEIVSQDNPVPRTEVFQITFQDIKQGDNVSVTILPEQADKIDNFEAEKFQILQASGQ